MNFNLDKKLLLVSIPLAYLLVRASENFAGYCPEPREGVIVNDAPGCAFGFPLPHVTTGGFTGGGIVWPILLINVTIVTVFIYLLFNYTYKEIKKK